jgi:DNA-binding response OmpR family regulator
MNVLIAEDDLTSRNMLASVLGKSGFDVLEATNGLEALGLLLGADAPKMAIIDWMMPEVDGLEVVRRVRARQTKLPPYIIMLTTRGEKSDIVKGLDVGADDYLAKPFDIGELRARINVGRRMMDLQAQLAAQVEEFRQAMAHIDTLRGILPICSFCKKIRNDEGYWDQVEAYVTRHSEATFSHSVCPECMKAHYSDFNDGTDDAT